MASAAGLYAQKYAAHKPGPGDYYTEKSDFGKTSPSRMTSFGYSDRGIAPRPQTESSQPLPLFLPIRPLNPSTSCPNFRPPPVKRVPLQRTMGLLNEQAMARKQGILPMPIDVPVPGAPMAKGPEAAATNNASESNATTPLSPGLVKTSKGRLVRNLTPAASKFRRPKPVRITPGPADYDPVNESIFGTGTPSYHIAGRPDLVTLEPTFTPGPANYKVPVESDRWSFQEMQLPPRQQAIAEFRKQQQQVAATTAALLSQTVSKQPHLFAVHKQSGKQFFPFKNPPVPGPGQYESRNGKGIFGYTAPRVDTR